MLALLVLLLAGCRALPVLSPEPLTPPADRATPAATPRQGGVLRYGLTLPTSGIDPHIHASSELGIALSSVYDTLVVQDQEHRFHPSLAESWAISDDGLVYTFRLRSDVIFHDGTPFNARAVVRNLERIADPATRSQKAGFLLGPFERAEAPDEFTAVIVLAAPYAPLLDGLSQVYLGMASPAALDRWGDRYQLHQVGTGPFRFVSYREREVLVIERNPGYAWAPSIRRHQGPAYLDAVEFRFYPDPATRLPALLSGQADVIGELPPRDAERLVTDESPPTHRLHPVAIPGLSVQFFLNTALPPLDDLNVRRALIVATDRSALVKAVFGAHSPVATCSLSAATPLALESSSEDDSYAYDPDQARALLAAAGWSDADGDGALEKNGEKLTVRAVVANWGEVGAVATILQASWRELGIDLQLEPMTYPAMLEAGRNKTHHMLPFVSSGTDASLLRTYYHGDNIGAFNWSQVDDPEVNAWLEEAEATSDAFERASRYRSVQNRIMAQAWVLPVRDPVNLNALSTRVRDLEFDVQGWFPVLYDAWLAPVQ